MLSPRDVILSLNIDIAMLTDELKCSLYGQSRNLTKSLEICSKYDPMKMGDAHGYTAHKKE